MSNKIEKSVVTALPARKYIRGCVVSAAVKKIGTTSLELETTAVRKTHITLSSGDSAMLDQQVLARMGEPIKGTVRIDAVSDDMLRLRYAEAQSVPENQTEMVGGTPPPALRCEITPIRGLDDVGRSADGKTLVDQVQIVTASLTVTVSLGSYRIRVAQKGGGPVLGIGGPEKNNFACFDACNTGIMRIGNGNRPIATETFDLRPGEAIYGLGEQFMGLNKRGDSQVTVPFRSGERRSRIDPATA